MCLCGVVEVVNDFDVDDVDVDNVDIDNVDVDVFVDGVDVDVGEFSVEKRRGRDLTDVIVFINLISLLWFLFLVS